MRALSVLIVLGVSILSSPVVADPMVPSSATESLLNAHPGLRVMAQGERAVALYGVPFATDADPGTSTDQFVQGFLDLYGDALGVDGVELGAPHKINIRDDKFTVYTYYQTIEDLPVYNTVVKIPVLLGTTEVIGHIGMHLVPEPEEALPGDVLTDSEAVAVVEDDPRYAGITEFGEAKLTIFEASNGVVHRAWRFHGWGEDGSFLFFVDTNTGDLVGVVNQVFEADVEGSVSGWATAGVGADTEENLPVETDLPGVQVSLVVGDDPPCPSDEGVVVAQDFTDIDGGYGFTNVDLPVRATSRLTSDWVTVYDCQMLDSCLDLFDGGDLDRAISCMHVSTESNPVDLGFNDPPEEWGTAQVNAFLGVGKTHDWFKALQPTFGAIDRNVPAITNAGSNAYYNRDRELLIFGGRIVEQNHNNWAFSTIISHEYGHFILDQLLEMNPTLPEQSAFNEGVPDTVAALTWDTPFIGLNLFMSGDPPIFLRRLDEPNVRLTDVECSSFPLWCRCEEGGRRYCRGLVLGGAFWDLRTAIGDQAAGEIFADFLFITDGRLDESVLVEVLMADDDDADLSNGTPHQTQIEASFIGLHGWSGPDCSQEQDVAVKWLGPIPPYEEPEAGIDYFVDYRVCPPNVTLQTTEKEEVPVERWYVGRGTQQEPGNLGTVYANWVGDPWNIAVEVGSDTDSEINCASVNVVEIPAQSEDNRSSIVLDLDASVLGRVQCYPVSNVGHPDFGKGGRIAGTVTGQAKRVLAEAVGVGDTGAGMLRVDSYLRELTVHSIPGGSQVQAYEVMDSLEVTGDTAGTIEVEKVSGRISLADLSGSLDITGEIGVTGSWIGWLFVSGTVGEEASITIADLVGTGTKVQFGPNACLAGALTLESGLKADQELLLDGTFPATGSVDFNGQDISGTMEIKSGAATTITGGAVTDTGYVVLAQGGNYAGYATFDAVAPDGVVMTELGNLTGTIHVLNGGVSGYVEVIGDMYGDIIIDGDVVSTGEVLVDGYITGNASITVYGEFDGNICAANLCAGGPLPPNIHLNFGPDGTICGWPPGDFPVSPHPETGGPTCIAGAKFCQGGVRDGDPCFTDADCPGDDVTPAGYCYDDCDGDWAGASCVVYDDLTGAARCYVPKNRYLTIDPTVNVSNLVAYHISLDPAFHLDEQYDNTCDVVEGFLSVPVCREAEFGCTLDPAPNAACQGTYMNDDDPPVEKPLFGWTSYIVEGPVEPRVWTEYPLFVAGCDIVPAATYELQVSLDGINPEEGAILEMPTSHRPTGITQFWGDVTGGPGVAVPWLPPEYATNFADIGAMILTFEGRGGPALEWCDLEIDHVINMADIDFLVKAFQGVTYPGLPEPTVGMCYLEPRPRPLIGHEPCSCSGLMGLLGGEGMGMPLTSVEFVLVPGRDLISAGEGVDVDVFVGPVPDLGTYQVALEVIGGGGGSLDLEDLLVDTTREDYVFGSDPVVVAHDLTGGRLGAVRLNNGIEVTQLSYLGTFTFRASPDAGGLFDVQIEDTTRTFLRDSDVAPVTCSPGESVTIGVDVECFLDEHCDDANDCTADTCVSQECVHNNEPIGTPCDDGLFCTATDECDGNGACVGIGDPCPPNRPKCCEATDECVKAQQECPFPT